MRRAGSKRTRVFVSITATCERRPPVTENFSGASTLVARPPGTRLGGACLVRGRASRGKAWTLPRPSELIEFHSIQGK